MKIRSLQLKNFKRFTDLTLQGIPDDAKLVLLIGDNGSGKSSVFDGLAHFASRNYKAPVSSNDDNSKNGGTPEIHIETDHGQGNIIGGNFKTNSQIKSTGFYGRTSFRQIPRLTRTFMGSNFDIVLDTDRPPTFIDRDERFENDLEHIYGRLLKEYFVNSDRSTIIEEVVNPINSSFERIFGNAKGTKLRLIEIIPPLEGNVAQINFEKGNSTFHYNYLSAGEKEVFNILINLLARKEYYRDTVFFYDEIDLHLNTKLQFNFLKEIIEHWIPDNCQFWTASHSLGFIQFAKESTNSVIFDFDDYDFDQTKTLVPEAKDNPNLYQIAVDKDLLPHLFEHFRIIFVENKDKDFYASLDIKKTLFVPENGRNGVYHKVKSAEYDGIVDRDFLTDSDLVEITKHYKKLKILRYYSVENYLYHPDNLEEYNTRKKLPFNKSAYIQKLIQEKNNVRDSIILCLSLKRTEYPYFGEPNFNGKPNQNRFKNKQENIEQSTILAGYLNSDSFEDFYRIFPMKTYATHFDERKNIGKSELSKTEWFKTKIEEIINQV
jgi:hypothetical protein